MSSLVLANQKVLQPILQYCQYCRTSSNAPARHEGCFITIPQKHHFIWKHEIERAINRKIPEEPWLACLKSRTLRVGFHHLITNFNGEYDRCHPKFLEQTGSPSIVETMPSQRHDRVTQRTMAEITQRKKMDLIIEKEQNEMTKSLAKIYRVTGQTSMEARDKAEKAVSSLLSSSSSSDSSPLISTLKISPTKVKFRYGLRYSDETRELVCILNCLGTPQRHISEAIRCFFQFFGKPNITIDVPSLSQVQRFIQEGGIMSHLQALARLHRLTSKALGHDGTTTKGRTIIGVAALGKEVEAIYLGSKEVVRQDAQNQANSITSLLTTLQSLASRFPETMAFLSDLDVSSFAAICSDHTNVNQAITKRLEIIAQQTLSDHHLFEIGCLGHKSDLVETALNHVLNSSRENSFVIFDESGDEINTHEMKMPKGPKTPHSAFHFLYILGNNLAATSEGNFGFARNFISWSIIEGLYIALKPFHSYRFHIYSHNALETYGYLGIYLQFVMEMMNQSSWTATFLIDAINSKRMRQEMRILSLFAFIFSRPIFYCFKTYSVAQAQRLWQKSEEILEYWISQSMLDLLNGVELRNLLTPTLWEFVIEEACDDNTKKCEILENQKRSWEKLALVLNDWNLNDTILWKESILQAVVELKKIGKEYLHGGIYFASVPNEIHDLPANNLFLESTFAKIKQNDTHANHYSKETIENQVMFKEEYLLRKPSLVLSETSKAEVRNIARSLPLQKDLDYELALERKRKREEDLQLLHLQAENREKKKQKREELLQNVTLLTNIAELDKLPQSKLRIQLMLHQNNHPNSGITLGGTKSQQLERLHLLLSPPPVTLNMPNMSHERAEYTALSMPNRLNLPTTPNKHAAEHAEHTEHPEHAEYTE